MGLLIGLPLSIARRAADMLVIHFGTIREYENGTVGDFALHIQCPWRIGDSTGIITGRYDLYFSAETSEYFDDVIDNGDMRYKFEKNLQDKKIGELLQGFDAITRSYINVTNLLVVEKVEADNFGGATIYLSGGYQLSMFPYSCQTEHWRFLQGATNEKHFVVSGSHIELE